MIDPTMTTLPQTALACPTCKALKDAEYPQKNTVLVWVTTKEPDGLEPFCEPTKFAFYNNGDPRKVVAACPNSDELLAAIQDRWPDVAVNIGEDVTWPLDPPGEATRHGFDVWINHRDDDIEADAHGTTLAQALAALYIALAVGAVKEGT